MSALASIAAAVPRPLLIDTDTASDDAVALMMALGSPAVRVVAITVVAGNVPVDIGARNASFVNELCGTSVPVHLGAAAPRVRALEPADWFHGADGLGDVGYRPASPQLADGDGADAIVAATRAHPGLEIVTLGPLTNLALALEREPRIAADIGRCVVMGGAPCCEGNVTPAAEYNIWVDPEAARQVFGAGLPVEMVGWQLSRGAAVLDAADIRALLALGTARAAFAIGCNRTAAEAYLRQTGETGIALPDPVAMAIALDPALCLDASAHRVEIECDSPLTRGMTVVDRLGVADDPRNRAVWARAGSRGRPTRICWRLDVAGWKKALRSALA